MILRCEVVRQVGFVWAYRGRVGDFYSQYETGRATVESQTQSARSRASTGTATSDEIAQIWQPPQPDTKIEHNQLDTTRGHNTGQPSGRRDE